MPGFFLFQTYAVKRHNMPFLPVRKKKRQWTRRRSGWGDQKFLKSKRWQETRKIYLSRNPICEVHAAAGVLLDVVSGGHIDHIIPRSVGGAELDIRNLMTLCRDCHSYKTGLEGHRQLIKPAPDSEEGNHYPTQSAKKQLIEKLAKGI